MGTASCFRKCNDFLEEPGGYFTPVAPLESEVKEEKHYDSQCVKKTRKANICIEC
jgi:hypothetical protein